MTKKGQSNELHSSRIYSPCHQHDVYITHCNFPAISSSCISEALQTYSEVHRFLHQLDDQGTVPGLLWKLSGLQVSQTGIWLSHSYTGCIASQPEQTGASSPCDRGLRSEMCEGCPRKRESLVRAKHSFVLQRTGMVALSRPSGYASALALRVTRGLSNPADVIRRPWQLAICSPWPLDESVQGL